MNITKHANHTHVTLSRRNLLTLLKALDNPPTRPAITRCDGQLMVTVVGQEDTPHYGDRERGDGPENVRVRGVKRPGAVV